MILLLLMLMLMLMQGIEQIKGEVNEKGEVKCVVCGTRRPNRKITTKESISVEYVRLFFFLCRL